MPLVYACIAPHGGEIVPALAGKKLRAFMETRNGMKALAADVKRARPDTIVIASPHNLRLHRHIGVVTAENSSGSAREGRKEIRYRAKCDMALAQKLVEAAEHEGIPVAGATYGVYEGPLSDLAMDWGTLIPLWFFLKGNRLKCKIVIVTPSRGIPLAQNYEFGKVVAEVAEGEKKRVVFVASADQAHAHKESGPYGYSPDAKKYDRLVVKAVNEGKLDYILHLKPDFVDRAKPDSLWQMTMLAGVLAVVRMEGRLLSYQAPTYYGMLCASYRPAPH
ncbi:MAG: extradiol ring-cleavage dioxygenase [Nitrososphaerota archaeon]|nr:extradiol ring-cleavage dioxygenase [Nitrososphaerota archaeon]